MRRPNGNHFYIASFAVSRFFLRPSFHGCGRIVGPSLLGGELGAACCTLVAALRTGAGAVTVGTGFLTMGYYCQ